MGEERKSVSLQCSSQGWFSSSGLGRGQCWFRGAEKIRLRLFSLGASNRIPIPRLLSLSILISNTIDFPLQSSEFCCALDPGRFVVNIMVVALTVCSYQTCLALPTEPSEEELWVNDPLTSFQVRYLIIWMLYCFRFYYSFRSCSIVNIR